MNTSADPPFRPPRDSGSWNRAIAIVGATATGKSDLAVELALRSNGEIINADAMQLYRGMDIGTAKLTPAEMRGIPHHQLDVLEVYENASVSHYQTKARANMTEIQSRGRPAILVGGSGLYLRAALDKIEFPGTDPEVRASYEARLETEGTHSLHDELRALDPKAAEGIGERNGRRIVRALEVIALTGRPYTAVLPTYQYHLAALQIGLTVDPDTLLLRIEARVNRMWEYGLVNEVEQLLERGIERGRTARRAVGYAQALAYLAGEISRDEAIEQTIRATRKLARRQAGWFTRDPRIHWLAGTDPDVVDQAVKTIESASGGQ